MAGRPDRSLSRDSLHYHGTADCGARRLAYRRSAADQIGRSLTGLSGPSAHANTVFTTLLERSGLLREPTSRRIDFVHRTFQEFLAAKAAIDSNAIGELIRNADNDQWAEVLVLAAGQANYAQAGQLLKGLLQHEQQDQHRRQILAVACLSEVRSVSPPARYDVEQVIPDLLPPRSMDQVEQLSTVGESLIPLLAQHWSREPRKAPESIRCAALIGGPSALELVHNISASSDDTRGLTAELRRAWQYFDVEEYARQVLGPAGAKSFDIDDSRYLNALTHVPSVENLNVFMRHDGITNLNILEGFPQLAHLRINNPVSNSEDWAGLANCPLLSNLTIVGGGRHLPPIPPLPYLTDLTIRDNEAF